VYTKNLYAHRGTDNQILIEFVNQDQKRVDLNRKTYSETPVTAGSFVVDTEYRIETVGTTDYTLIGAADNVIGTEFTATGVGTGDGTASTIVYTELEFTCRIISHDGTRLELEKPLAMVNSATGQTKLVLTEEELDLIAPGKYGWSVEQTLDGALYEPVYVDDFSGARGVMDIVDSIMPSFIASEVITIPTGQVSPYVSSILNTDATNLHTFQITMDNFTGTILIEGAADTDDNWYTIQSDDVTEDNSHNVNVDGYHPYIRFTFTEGTNVTAGSFTIGNEYTIEATGTTDFTLIGAADSNPGTIFTATGVGVGDGTAIPTDPDFPGNITEILHR
jgi:hypothetical protein